MAEALIALGGNVGDVPHTFNEAIAMLGDGGTINLVGRSSNYSTPAWGRTDQPSFVNAALKVRTTLPPHELLARTQEIERRLGRTRKFGERWGPRTLDIDLIAYDGLTIDTPDLTLPHPRALERAFVLVPLAEIEPDWRIAGIRVADALAKLDQAGIEKL